MSSWVEVDSGDHDLQEGLYSSRAWQYRSRNPSSDALTGSLRIAKIFNQAQRVLHDLYEASLE